MSATDFPHRPGISDEFLAKAGVTVLPDPERLHIPYHDIDGTPTGHYRDRFKAPVTGSDGKPQRYSQPFESGMHAYLPQIPLVKGEDLFVTEGEFKALALCESGYNAVGLPGLFCYCDGEILPGLAQAVGLVAPPAINFIGDADTLFNLDFYRSAKFLADAFKGTPVRLIQPPLDGPKGVDDVKEETGRRFNRWLDAATQDAALVVKGQNFVQTAAIRLEEKARTVTTLHLERLMKMAVEATKTSEPLWARNHLIEIIQKCSKLKQAHFDKALKEKLNEGTEQSIGADHKDELLAHYDWIKNNPWSDPVELSDTLQELYDLTKIFIATEDDTRILAALWVGITYARNACPSKDPNLQNVPKLREDLFPIRSLFQAPPGRKLVIADFAQMELVAAAVLAPEPKMLAAFQNGEDLHCRTASILLGRTVTKSKSDKADRSLAKAVNFGLLYGQSAPGLKTYAKNSYGVTMTDEEAVQFREAFFQEYQGLAAWHETARAAANDPEVTEVRTHRIGRRQHLADAEHWWPRFASLVNTPIQGSCAEVQKLGMLDIGEKLKGRAQLVSCVHDEVIVECAEDDAEAIMAEVQAIMETRSAQVFNGQKIGVEAHVEDNWAGVKMPTYTDTRSTENAAQIELVLCTSKADSSHRLPRDGSPASQRNCLAIECHREVDP